MKQLLKIDAVDFNYTNNEGKAPLSTAANNGCIGTVKLLLQLKNIWLDIKAGNKTALQWAQENKHHKIINFIKTAISFEDKRNDT